MKRLYEIQNYANNQIFDLYEINEFGQKYKRFRIMKQELKRLMTPLEAHEFEMGNIKTVFLNERQVESASSVIY